MRFIRILTITVASLLVVSERVVGEPIGIRMDETIRLGSSYGLMVDMDTAYAQEETLGPIFRSQFKIFKDLNPANIRNYTRTYPNEFWAFNNYLRYLYRDGLITAEALTRYRAASVAGLKSYIVIQRAQWLTPSPIVRQPKLNTSIDILKSAEVEAFEDLDNVGKPEEFKEPEETPIPVPTQTPELDRFLEVAKDVSSGKAIEDSLESKALEKADEVISSEVQSYLSERFKTVRLQGRLFSDDGDPEVNLGLVTSLSDTDSSTLFNQIDFTARDDATVASIGLGYRTQLNNSTVAGVNVFIDHNIPNDHTRASLGLEWKNTYVSLTANQYVPLSDYQTTAKHESQRPAEGYDLNFSVTTPDWPLSWTYRTALWDLGDRGQNRIQAYGLKGSITDELNLQVENLESSQASTSTVSKLTYTYRFDEEKDASLLPDPSLFESTRYRFVVRDQTMPMATKITNQPPVANDSTLSVTTGSTNSIDVTSLISDPDGDPLTIAIVVNPSHGSATLNGNVISYSHDGSSATTDSITYQVEDGYGGTDTGVITINPTNQPPVASNSTFSITEGTSLTIDLSRLVSDPDGDDVNLSLVNIPSYADFNSSPSLVIDLTSAYLSDNVVIIDYQAEDPDGATDQGRLTLDVTHKTVNSACDGRLLTRYVNKGNQLSLNDITDPSTEFYWAGNGHIYKVVNVPTSWNDAVTASVGNQLSDVSGHLVTITSQAEHDFIASIVDPNYSYWIGGSDASVEGCWEWIGGPETGETFVYTNWDGNPLRSDDYAKLNNSADKGWNAQPATNLKYYVIEYSGVSHR